jgi:hypothetical protein
MNPLDDTDGSSFEAFLSDMIVLIARDAAASGKVNPAYTQLAARLAAAQLQSASGVARSSYVNPAAGSTPVGRTESARLANAISEAAPGFAALGMPLQRDAAAAPEPAAAKTSRSRT